MTEYISSGWSLSRHRQPTAAQSLTQLWRSRPHQHCLFINNNAPSCVWKIESIVCGADFEQTSAVAKESKLHCDIRASFATAFRNWRLKNNVPLKKIAKDLGVSIATVNSWSCYFALNGEK
jgi:hypothetical protein